MVVRVKVAVRTKESAAATGKQGGKGGGSQGCAACGSRVVVGVGFVGVRCAW